PPFLLMRHRVPLVLLPLAFALILAACSSPSPSEPPSGFYLSSSSDMPAMEEESSSLPTDEASSPAEFTVSSASSLSPGIEDSSVPSAMTGTGGMTPSHTVVAVYQDRIARRGDQLQGSAYESNPYLTASFRSALRNWTISGDPFFCLAQKPPAFATVASQ